MKNTTKSKEISVFIASPGDLAPERKTFKETIDTLNAGFADGAGVKFVAHGWEEINAQTGRRVQDVINQKIEQCDVFILAMHRRWGQDASDSDFSSYTEEEFNLALGLWRKRKSPEVMVFFRTVDSESLADQGPQLKKVLQFRKKLESAHKILIRCFNTEVDFGKEVDRHLRAFARGEWKALDDNSPAISFATDQIKALTKAERAGKRRVERAQKRKASGGKGKSAPAKPDLSLVDAQQSELALARAAVEAANDGRTQDARILFSKATEGTTDLSILSLAAAFFRHIGESENASRLERRQTAIAQDRKIAAEHYLALVPGDLLRFMQEQMLTTLLAQLPKEAADELRSIYEEVFGGGRLEQMLTAVMVKHYTKSEIVQLARYLATPDGQSCFRKQPAMMQDFVPFVQKEFQRVMLRRHPELARDMGELQQAIVPALPAAMQLKQLADGPEQDASAASA